MGHGQPLDFGGKWRLHKAQHSTTLGL